MKEVLIFYASYGGGHLSAARSVKEYIETNYNNVHVTLLDCMEYINKILNKLTTTAYNEMAKKAPNLWGHLYYDSEKGPIKHLSMDANKLMSYKLKNLLDEKHPDLIISTHFFPSTMCAYLKQKNKLDCPIATIMTDYAPHDQWLVMNEYIDYFFVSHDGMKQELIGLGVDEKKIHATGIPVSQRFLKEYNKSDIIKEFELSNDKKTILFFGGGQFGLGKGNTLKIFEALVKCSANIQIVAISGKNQKMKESFENIVSSYNKNNTIKILEFTNKVPELMSISTLIITKPGGLTTTESLVSGLPIVVINPIPGQEESNAKYLEDNKVAIWLKDTDNAESILNDLLNDELKLDDMHVHSMLLAKPNSTKDICKILLGINNL